MNKVMRIVFLVFGLALLAFVINLAGNAVIDGEPLVALGIVAATLVVILGGVKVSEKRNKS